MKTGASLYVAGSKLGNCRCSLHALSTTLEVFALLPKNLQAGYLWWRIMQFTLPEQSDWCDNMTLRSYNCAPVLPVKVSRPYFSTRLQGAHENLVSGDETTTTGAYRVLCLWAIVLTVRDSKYNNQRHARYWSNSRERCTIVEFPSIPFFNQLWSTQLHFSAFWFVWIKKQPESILERVIWVEI